MEEDIYAVNALAWIVRTTRMNRMGFRILHEKLKFYTKMCIHCNFVPVPTPAQPCADFGGSNAAAKPK
jgi:hypothetical protein